jgi:hypothetical protein
MSLSHNFSPVIPYITVPYASADGNENGVEIQETMFVNDPDSIRALTHKGLFEAV